MHCAVVKASDKQAVAAAIALEWFPQRDETFSVNLHCMPVIY